MMRPTKLEVRDLRIAFGDRRVVDLERLDLGTGEIVGLAGESGSGKSMTALAVLGLASTLGARVTGSIRLVDQELVGAPESRLREIRGRRIAMIFQSPVSSLDPLLRVGELFERTLRPLSARCSCPLTSCRDIHTSSPEDRRSASPSPWRSRSAPRC